MALVKCRECGDKISSSAKLCPHCGKENKQMGLGSWIAAIFFSLIVYSMISNHTNQSTNVQSESVSPSRHQVQSDSNSPKPPPVSEVTKEEASKTEVLTITADQLMSSCAMDYDAAMSMGADSEYYKNQIRFMNKTIAVTGTVFHVLRDSSANPESYIALKAGFPWAPDGNTVQCFPQENEKESFENIQRGQSVTIIGRFDNYGRTRQFAEQENAGNSSFKGSGYYARIKECKIAN